MYIWYISLYEPLPLGGDKNRLMRSGMLSKALHERGHEIELWLPGFEHVHHEHYKKSSCIETSELGFRVQYIKGLGYKNDISFRRFIHNLLIAGELKKLIKKRARKPDLIITQIPLLEFAYIATKYAQQEHIPIITDIRDLWPDVYKRIIPNKLHFLYKFLLFRQIKEMKFIVKNSTAITAVSNTFLKWGIVNGQRQNNLDKAFYIGYPCNKKAIKPNMSSLDLNLPSSAEIIFFSGTFCDSYDFDTVLKAAEKIRNINKNIIFIFAGKGEGEDKIIEFAEKLENILYLGWLESQELDYILSISLIGLAPYSKHSLMSLPNKPFEYMAASIPILNSLKGELSILIEEEKCGLNYIPDDSDDFIDKVLFLVNNKKISKQMGINGRNVLEKKFCSHFIYENFSKHIETMV